MAKKLNSMRILEQHDIVYEAIQYPTEIKDAEEVAEAVGIPYHMVFKTLVVESAKSNSAKPFLAIIPSDRQLDLKKMAAAAGEKKVQMAAQKDAEKQTGLQVGGISALALTQKNWNVYLDRSASELEHIVMSAGQRGTQLKVHTAAFIRLVHAQLADISTDIE
ncbi:MAG: aminoacyl-tRNA deacylase [Chloroflexota bacterium]